VSAAAAPRPAWLKPVLIVAGVLVAINVALSLLPGPSGPGGSSYATSSRGLAAWAALLDEYGYEVQRLRKRPDRARLDPRGTVVVADPDTLTRGEAEALVSFVERGGRLVAAASGEPRWMDRLVPVRPLWTDEAPGHWAVSARVPETRGVQTVESAGDGEWVSGGSGTPLLEAGSTGALMVAFDRGRGRVILLADASPLENRRLDRADNAALALALAGNRDRPVRFAEALHGYGESRGLGALPGRWRLALLGLALAIALWMLARVRRIGPPDSEPEAPPPPRREFVDAMALTLERTGDPAGALEPLRRRLEERVAARAELYEPGDAELEEAALESGLDAEAARAVAGRSDDVVALGRALARLSQGERHGHRVTRR
jgi:hypothetical protein